MNLQENISRIKEMMGLITEETTNLSVSGSFTASNCDELHAFQGTGGKTVGDMNGIVGNKIKEWNKKNINVKPEKVTVKVNDMNVSWTVNFVESSENYDGFTSRGAGCNNNIEKRAGSDSINNGKQSVIDNLLKKGIKVIKIEEFDSVKYDGGDNSFKQVFYRYITEDKQNKNNKTSKKPVKINATNLKDFTEQIREKTFDKKIDLSSIKIDIDNFELEFIEDESKPKIKRLSLAYSPSVGKSCESCNNIQKENKNNFKIIKFGEFESGRIYKLYVLSN